MKPKKKILDMNMRSSAVAKLIRSVEAVWEFFSIAFSFIDIVCDLVIAYTYWKEQRFRLFYASISILVVAHSFYTIFFLLSFCKPSTKMKERFLLFFLILPFAQLIPFFTWVESKEYDSVNNLLKKMGFQPRKRNKQKENDRDELYEAIMEKAEGHAGFIIEAFVEAIPQCVLQTYALCSSLDEQNGVASYLSVFSIFMSILVIASKGYLISYSMHVPTFIFNILCIFADCFNLFATVTWLALGISGANSSKMTTVWINLLEKLLWTCIRMAVTVLVSLPIMCIAHHAQYTYDHGLKAGWRNFIEEAKKLLRTCAKKHLEKITFVFITFISSVPFLVIFLSAKLLWIPIVVFKSLNAKIAKEDKEFYRPIMNFLLENRTQQELDRRLMTTNIALAEEYYLSLRIKKRHRSMSKYRGGTAKLYLNWYESKLMQILLRKDKTPTDRRSMMQSHKIAIYRYLFFNMLPKFAPEGGWCDWLSKKGRLRSCWDKGKETGKSIWQKFRTSKAIDVVISISLTILGVQCLYGALILTLFLLQSLFYPLVSCSRCFGYDAWEMKQIEQSQPIQSVQCILSLSSLICIFLMACLFWDIWRYHSTMRDFFPVSLLNSIKYYARHNIKLTKRLADRVIIRFRKNSEWDYNSAYVVFALKRPERLGYSPYLTKKVFLFFSQPTSSRQRALRLLNWKQDDVNDDNFNHSGAHIELA